MIVTQKNSKYLGLIREIALTDFKLKYQGSFLGYLWSLVKPLMLFLVLYVVFAKILKIGGSIPSYPIYLLLGIVIWGFFSELTSVSLAAIVSSGDLIRKVYFPRIVLVIARGITALLTFVLNLIVVFLFMAYLHIIPSTSAVFAGLILFELFILAVGVSFFLSALFVKYRDVSHIWEVFMQAFFYATPIIYPLNLVPEKYSPFLVLNPLAQIIQDFRYMLVTHQTETAWSLLPIWLLWIPYTLPVVIFALGYSYFNKSASKFAEEV